MDTLKVSQLDEITTTQNSDIMELVQDGGGGSFTSKKITYANFLASITSNYVANTRTISTTAPLSGGGDLSANRTLTIADASTSSSGVVTATTQTLSGGKTWLSPATGTVCKIIKGASGQTADLTQWQTNAGTVLARVNSAGNFLIGYGATSPSFNIDVFSGSSVNASLRLKATSSGNSAFMILDSGATSNPYISFRRGGGETFLIRSNNNSYFSIYSYLSAPNAESLVINGTTHAATFTGAISTTQLSTTGNVANAISMTRTDNAATYILSKNLNTGNATTVGLQMQTSTGSSYIGRYGTGSSTVNLQNSTVIQEGGTNGIVFYTTAEKWRIKQDGTLVAADATNIEFNATTGSKIGTASSQKIGFWNAAPVVQPSTSTTEATLVSNGGTTITSTDTFDGYTIAKVVKALRDSGLLA